MAISAPIVEYLLAQRSKTGDRLAYPGLQQFIVPTLGPGAQLVVQLAPPNNMFAAIKHSATISTECVPGTIYMEVSQAGVIYAAGWNEQDWQGTYIDYFVMFTEANPITFLLSNTSNVNQRFSGTQWVIQITDEQHLQEVRDHINALSGLVTNQLQAETNRLLQAIDLARGGVAPLPRAVP